MSKPDKHSQEEFAYLEEQLRQSRPPTDSPSPQFRRRLRAQLMENPGMNERNWTFGRFAAAVAAIVLVVGIPLFFWSMQSSLSRQGAAQQPPAQAGIGAVDASPTPVSGAGIVSAPPTAVAEPGASPTPPPTVTPFPPTAVPPTVEAGEVTITHVGEPAPFASEEIPAEFPQYQFTVEAEYTLAGAGEALLLLGYEATSASGAATGGETIVIGPGSDSVSVDLTISDEFVTAEGQLDANVTPFARINVYDPDAEVYVNLYPGDAKLSPFEQNQPYPYLATRDFLALDAITVTEGEAGETVLTLDLTAVLDSAPEGTVTAVVTADGTELATTTADVSQEAYDHSLPLTLEAVDPDTPLTVTATLAVGDVEKTAVADLTLADLSGHEENEVWIVDVTAQQEGESSAVEFTLVVGYHLGDAYTAGQIAQRSSFAFTEAAAGSGGGGGGGGSRTAVPPGVGMTVFSFSHEGGDLNADNWQAYLSLTVTLSGVDADGAETLLDTVERPDDIE